MACINRETFDIYHNDQLLFPNGYFEVDEDIAPAIQVLNRKGYITECCCSGHPLLDNLIRNAEVEYVKTKIEANSYIIFKEGIALPTLPPGFVDSSYDARVTIRNFYRYIDKYFELKRIILESMEQLYKWTLNLPDFIN